jgi:putative phosphoesterase
VKRFIVGLISDTHGLVRPDIRKAFAGVDLILHAGDVGGQDVLDALAAMAPIVEAVYGNVDDPHDPALAKERVVTVGAITIHVSHGHELGRPTPALVLARYSGEVVVFGHTHRAVTVTEAGRLAVNPGAAGPGRFDVKPSVARLVIEDRHVHVESVALA